jgi:hypothetical protein
MASSGMLRRVAVVTPDVSEERCAFFIRGTRICELGATPVVLDEGGSKFLRNVRSYKSHSA